MFFARYKEQKMKIYEEITVDITNPYPLPKMQAQQGNIGRGARIKLVHNGSLIELDKEVINLYAKLPNTKDAVYLSTTIESGIIKADFTNVMLSKVGEVQVELQIVEDDQTNGTEITTPIFTVVVNPSNIDTDNIIESTEYNALVDALAELQYYREHGLKGDKGDAATVEVGTVTTLEAGQPATVKNAGTTTDAIFNFGIPKGPKGDKGDPGAVQTVNDTAPDANGNVTIKTVPTDAANIATNTANIATNTANIATNTSNISKKQDTLVSGTNIKTVNGNSLLGSGNISIDGIKVWTCTLSTTWTQDSTNGYYYQSVTVSGITSSDYPTLDVVTSGTLSNIQTLQNEWAKIVQAETSTNTIKFYAKEATTTSLTVLVKR